MAYSQEYQNFNKRKKNGQPALSPSDLLNEINAKIEANQPAKMPLPASNLKQRMSNAQTTSAPDPWKESIWGKINSLENSAINSNAAKAISNTLPVKFLNRAGFSAANTIAPGGAIGSNPDMGAVGNAVADIVGFGAGMAVRNPAVGGASINSALSPVGNYAVKGVNKGLNKVTPLVPTTVGKVANYALPTAVRGASEFGLYGGLNNAVQGKDVVEGAKEGALSGALFNVGLKGLGSGLNKVGSKLVKSNTTSPNVETATKPLTTPTSKPLTLQEGLNNFNQSRLNNIPEYRRNLLTEKVDEEVLFDDPIKGLNAGKVVKVNKDNTAEIVTPEGNIFKVKKNGNTHEGTDKFDTVLSEPTPKEQHTIEDRLNMSTKDELKSKDIKPYQELHPELKPYIQNEANIILGELEATTKGGIQFNKSEYFQDGFKITGDKRNTSSTIASLRNEGFTYESIEKALKNIIKDNGSENTPVAKKVEAIIDQRLSNGYSDFRFGDDVPVNGEYVSLKNKIENGESLQNSLKTGDNTLQGTNTPQSGKVAQNEAISKQNNVFNTDGVQGQVNPAMGATNRTKFSFDIVSSDKGNKTTVDDVYNKFREEFFDRNKAIDDFSKEAKDETYIKATNSANSGTVVDRIMNDGMVDTKGNKIDVSYKELIESMPEDKADFQNYLLQRHNIDRAREGKAVDNDELTGFTSEQSAEVVRLIEKQHPEYKAAADRYTQWINKFMKTWGNETGLVSDDMWKAWNDTYKNYIPTNRDFSSLEKSSFGDNKSGFTNQNMPVKKAKGSSKDVVDPYESVMSLVNRTVRSAKANSVAQSLLESLRNNPEGLKKWGEVIPEWQDVPANVRNIVTVLDKGKKVHIRINDERLLNALEGFKKAGDTPIENTLRKGTGWFKSLITTKNPLFGVFNAARDIPTAYINGTENNLLKFGKNYVEAAKDVIKNTDAAKQYHNVGGGDANFNYEGRNATKSLNKLTSDKTIFSKAGDVLNSFNNTIEDIPRLAEFKASLAKGNSIEQALYDAGEVTTNFSKSGKITKTIDSGVPYLNAGFQGLDKFVRQYMKHPVATTAKSFVAITVPTLAVDALNADNPYYAELDNRAKDNYFNFPNPADGGKTFIRIPKTREYGVLFGSLFERMIRQYKGEENAFKGFGNTIVTNFGPANPFTANIATPLYNLKTNKDFANRTIVPQSLQGLTGANRYLQYDDKTSAIGKKIGELANLSPKQVDYIIDAYTGIIGDVILPATTKGDGTGNPIASILQKKFTNDPLYSNQNITDFYDNMDKAISDAKAKNVKEGIDGDTTTHEEYVSNMYSAASKEISDLTKQVTQANTVGDTETVKKLRQQIIDIAKDTNSVMGKKAFVPPNELKAKISEQMKYNDSKRATAIRKEATLIMDSNRSNAEKSSLLQQLFDSRAKNLSQGKAPKKKADEVNKYNQ